MEGSVSHDVLGIYVGTRVQKQLQNLRDKRSREKKNTRRRGHEIGNQEAEKIRQGRVDVRRNRIVFGNFLERRGGHGRKQAILVGGLQPRKPPPIGTPLRIHHMPQHTAHTAAWREMRRDKRFRQQNAPTTDFSSRSLTR